jgi:dnaB-like helicase N terminal domain
MYFDYEKTQVELLRALIAQPDMIAEVSENINEEDFENYKYQSIYKSIFNRNMDGENLNKISISNDVLENDAIELSEEDIYLLFNDITPVEPPTELAKMLKRHSIKSKTTQRVSSFNQTINTPNINLINELGTLQDDLELLGEELTQQKTETFDDKINKYLEIVKNKEKKEGIKSLYPSLDNFTGGWLPEQLITIAARTSVGKSVFALNCALAAALEGKKVLYFSLEMGSAELISRLVACHGLIKLNDIYPHLNLTREEDLVRFEQTIKDLRQMPEIIIDDSTNVTVNYIKTRATNEKRKNGLDFIIIDYIQLIDTSPMKGRPRHEQIAEISRSLKVLAKQLEVPVMIVAQLNREGKDDEDSTPSMSDIRESAAIAADSDIVVIIDRKYRDTSEKPTAKFMLDKNRNGPAGKRIDVNCMLDKALFQDKVFDEDQEEEF